MIYFHKTYISKSDLSEGYLHYLEQVSCLCSNFRELITSTTLFVYRLPYLFVNYIHIQAIIFSLFFDTFYAFASPGTTTISIPAGLKMVSGSIYSSLPEYSLDTCSLNHVNTG